MRSLFAGPRRPERPATAALGSGTGEAETRVLEDFQKHYGIHFHQPGLLRLALTHRSYLSVTGQGPNESNERMEFLGDSVLGLVTSEYLYREHPGVDEGELTKTKSLLVSKNILSRRALNMGLGRYVLMSHSEAESGGRQRLSILADAFESVICAVYLDQGFEDARRFIRRWLLDDAGAISADKRHTNYKSQLQEYVQSTFHTHPVYRIRNAMGPDHSKMFLVEVVVRNKTLGSGKGKNKKEAEQAAARDALDHVGASRRERRDERGPGEAREPRAEWGSREGRAPREARDAREERAPREARDAREERAPREARDAREERAPREARDAREERAPREARDAREERAPREARDAREERAPREARDAREERAPREARDAREQRAPREARDAREERAPREARDAREERAPRDEHGVRDERGSREERVAPRDRGPRDERPAARQEVRAARSPEPLRRAPEPPPPAPPPAPPLVAPVDADDDVDEGGFRPRRRGRRGGRGRRDLPGPASLPEAAATPTPPSRSAPPLPPAPLELEPTEVEPLPPAHEEDDDEEVGRPEGPRGSADSEPFQQAAEVRPGRFEPEAQPESVHAVEAPEPTAEDTAWIGGDMSEPDDGVRQPSRDAVDESAASELPDEAPEGEPEPWRSVEPEPETPRFGRRAKRRGR